jgi:hypothetical protein
MLRLHNLRDIWMSIKYWMNDIKKDKRMCSNKCISHCRFAHHYSHVHSPVIVPSPPRSWYGRPDIYLFAKHENLFSFLFLSDPSASPVQAKHPLINTSVAFLRHPQVQSLGCTMQPTRPTVTDYCVSMPHADISCFWLQDTFCNSWLLLFSWMITR